MAKSRPKPRGSGSIPAKGGRSQPASTTGSRPHAAAQPPPRRFPVFWVALGAVVAIAVVAVIVSVLGGSSTPGSGGGGSTGREFGTVTVHGTALLPLPDSGRDPAVGDLIPTVAGQSFRGSRVTIAPNGTAQMIVFLAHWCPHCNREAPKLAAFLRQHGGVPAGVTLTIVPTGSNPQAPNWPPSQWVTTMGLGSVTTLVDDKAQTAAGAFGLTAYPFIVSVDAQGRVVDRRSGEQADGFFDRAFTALAAGNAFPSS